MMEARMEESVEVALLVKEIINVKMEFVIVARCMDHQF